MLVIAMLLTIVLVEAGTVYKTVVVVSVAAPLNRGVISVGIIYYLSLNCAHKK